MSTGTIRTLLGVKDPRGSRIVIWDTKDVSVGRSPENDLVVDDSNASRRHALLSRAGGDHVVEDLGTLKNTVVNGESIEKHTLANRDVIQIAEVEITFIQSSKDPAALGLDVVYASELKGFATSRAGLENPGATPPGVIELEAAEEPPGQFKVGSVGDFDVPDSEELHQIAAPPDLDPEMEDWSLDSRVAEVSPDPAAGRPNAGSLALRVEIEGISPELSQTLTALLGKTIELPPLRLRLTAGD